MENFKYCIWFTPQLNHPWYNYTQSFLPHMTIKSKLDETNLNKYKNILYFNKQIEIKLVGKLYQDKINDFYALQYDVEVLNKNEIPDWWPDNPHISFRYRYNIPHTEKEIEDISKIIEIKTGLLDCIQVYKCSGHFREWTRRLF